MDLSYPEDAIGIAQERFYSQEWWVLPVASPLSMEMSTQIEKKFYMGEKNDKFEILMLPNVGGVKLVAISFAHKSVMSAEDFAKVGIPLEVPKKSDMFIMADMPKSVVTWILKNFGSLTKGLN